MSLILLTKGNITEKEFSTWVIKLGSMNRGSRNTANWDSGVNAFAGVKSTPNDIMETITEMLFRKKIHCKIGNKIERKK